MYQKVLYTFSNFKYIRIFYIDVLVFFYLLQRFLWSFSQARTWHSLLQYTSSQLAHLFNLSPSPPIQLPQRRIGSGPYALRYFPKTYNKEHEKINRLREKFSYPRVLQFGQALYEVWLSKTKEFLPKKFSFNHSWLKNGARKNEWNDRGMGKLKGIFNIISSSMRFAFFTFKMNFNSTVIWRQFSTVSLLFF